MAKANSAPMSQSIPSRTLLRSLGLATLALVIGSWSAFRSETITFDTANFLRFASQLSQAPWWDPTDAPEVTTRHWLIRQSPLLATLDHHAQHPGFAAAVAIVHNPLALLVGQDDRTAWVLSATIVSLIGFAWLVVGVYAFGREWLGEAAGATAALLACVSPPLVRIASDGLSDAPSAALLIWSTIYFARYLRQHDGWTLAVGGILSGIGYLFRPEAIQIGVAMTLFLLGQLFYRPRQIIGFQRLATHLVILALFVFPYMAIKGSPLTKKSYLLDPLVLRSIKTSIKESPTATPVPPCEIHAVPSITPLPAVSATRKTTPSPAANALPASTKTDPSSLPSYIPAIDLRWERYRAGIGIFSILWSALLAHTAIALLPIGLIIAIIRRPTLVTALVLTAMLANFLLLPLLLYGACGYLDVRHVVPTFILTLPVVWPAALMLCNLLRDTISNIAESYRGRGAHWPMSAESAAALPMGLLIVGIGITSGILRSNHQTAGMRSIGLWMNERLPQKAIVVDPSYVSAFYAGMDSRNRWPYVGNLSCENLLQILDVHPETNFLVLSDRHLRSMTGADQWPSTLGNWRLHEIHAVPESSKTTAGCQVRLFEITPHSTSQTAGLQSEPPAH